MKAQKKKSIERHAREQRRVLVISDNEIVDESNAALLSSLESASLKVVDVAAAVAAPISIKRSRPQIVIANLPIKGFSIQELTTILNKSQDGLQLIAVGSEAATLKRRQDAMQAGAFDYFQVPEELELLTMRTNQLVEMRQTMDQLRGEADLDHLTGLANRRRFRTALSREVERWRRYGVPCTLLLLDIDHMKAINDTYGHPSGDLVIREIADTLARVSRDNDTAARLGGEEFALLFAGIGATKAESAAKRLLAILNELEIEGVGHITVSIGLASCPDHANSERSLYAASDEALYVAKNEGRNQVAVAPLLQENLFDKKA